jgi:hypothetical protein
MSDTSARYLGWLRETKAGVNYVTATIPLWGNGPAPSPSPRSQLQPEPAP